MLEPQINNPAPLPDYVPPPGVFGTKVPSSVTFAVAVLLFLMPFIEITCNSVPIQKVNGLQLATGFRVKSDFESLGAFGPVGEKKDQKTQKESPNMYALIALTLGIVGFILSMGNLKAGGIGGIITGLASAICLIALMVDIGAKIKPKIPSDGPDDVKITAGFTPWFYITIIVFIVAAFFSYKRMQANYK